MGKLKIDYNTTLNLMEYGLKPGDLIKVTCVGAGGGHNYDDPAAIAVYNNYCGFGYGAGLGYMYNNGVSSTNSGKRGNVSTIYTNVLTGMNKVPITVGKAQPGVTGGTTSFGTQLSVTGGSNGDVRIDKATGYSSFELNIPGSGMRSLEVMKHSDGVVVIEW